VQTTPRSVVIRSTFGVFEPRFLSASELLSEISTDVSAITWSRTVSEIQIADSHDPWVFKEQADYGGGFKNYISHLKFMLYTYSTLKKINPGLIYACDLDTLIPSLAWGRKKSYLLIFDQFDPLSVKANNPILSRLLDRIETVLSKKANFRITPNISRIESHYASEWIEIKNLFEFEKSEPSDQSSFNCLKLFYGGVLSSDRGLIALSSAVATLPQWEFQIFGQGPELVGLQSLNNSRIMTKGLLDHKLLMKEAQKADLYAALYDPKFNHNKKTASNKLFEAAQLGIPLLASKNTYLGEIVEKQRLGWTVHYDDIQGIMDVLTSCGEMELQKKSEIKENLQEYFLHQLIAKRESLNRLSNEVKRALGT
jgi:glycosyltransferase involved in cell wall biosynthesis